MTDELRKKVEAFRAVLVALQEKHGENIAKAVPKHDATKTIQENKEIMDSHLKQIKLLEAQAKPLREKLNNPKKGEDLTQVRNELLPLEEQIKEMSQLFLGERPETKDFRGKGKEGKALPFDSDEYKANEAKIAKIKSQMKALNQEVAGRQRLFNGVKHTKLLDKIQTLGKTIGEKTKYVIHTDGKGKKKTWTVKSLPLNKDAKRPSFTDEKKAKAYVDRKDATFEAFKLKIENEQDSVRKDIETHLGPLPTKKAIKEAKAIKVKLVKKLKALSTFRPKEDYSKEEWDKQQIASQKPPKDWSKNQKKPSLENLEHTIQFVTNQEEYEAHYKSLIESQEKFLEIATNEDVKEKTQKKIDYYKEQLKIPFSEIKEQEGYRPIPSIQDESAKPTTSQSSPLKIGGLTHRLSKIIADLDTVLEKPNGSELDDVLVNAINNYKYLIEDMNDSEYEELITDAMRRDIKRAIKGKTGTKTTKEELGLDVLVSGGKSRFTGKAQSIPKDTKDKFKNMDEQIDKIIKYASRHKKWNDRLLELLMLGNNSNIKVILRDIATTSKGSMTGSQYNYKWLKKAKMFEPIGQQGDKAEGEKEVLDEVDRSYNKNYSGFDELSNRIESMRTNLKREIDGMNNTLGEHIGETNWKGRKAVSGLREKRLARKKANNIKDKSIELIAYQKKIKQLNLTLPVTTDAITRIVDVTNAESQTIIDITEITIPMQAIGNELRARGQVRIHEIENEIEKIPKGIARDEEQKQEANALTGELMELTELLGGKSTYLTETGNTSGKILETFRAINKLFGDVEEAEIEGEVMAEFELDTDYAANVGGGGRARRE